MTMRNDVLPRSGRKPGAGSKAKLTECHSQFLIDYVDEHPAAVLSDIRRALCEAFPDLSISYPRYINNGYRNVS
jgi:hypothetical protein